MYQIFITTLDRAASYSNGNWDTKKASGLQILHGKYITLGPLDYNPNHSSILSPYLLEYLLKSTLEIALKNHFRHET